MLLSPYEQWGGGGGAARFSLFVVFFSLFGRQRAGLATVYSSFFGLAINSSNVRNNNNSNNNNNNIPSLADFDLQDLPKNKSRTVFSRRPSPTPSRGTFPLGVVLPVVRSPQSCCYHRPFPNDVP